MKIADTFETAMNLTDKNLEPAAAALFDLLRRGHPEGYKPFSEATQDEYDDHMTAAEWAVKAFLTALPANGED